MNADYQIPEPYLFNPIKHHLGFIKEFINHNIDNYRSDDQSLIKTIRHLGGSVMDIYTYFPRQEQPVYFQGKIEYT